MRVLDAQVIPIEIPKKKAFRVAYATRRAALSLILKLTTDTGHLGWGEAVPVAEITGEDRGEVYRALVLFCQEILIGCDPLEQEELRCLAGAFLDPYPSARCALDTALWDLRGQAWGVGLKTLMGNARTDQKASISLGIQGIQETIAEARGHLNEGFREIKVKIGLDPLQDLARIKALRKELGHGWSLYLDANQGYTPNEAIEVAQALDECQVEFIEQPVAASDLDGLSRVSRESPILIAADEAVRGPDSLLKILGLQAAGMVNIKLMKCGGPTQAALMLRMAEEAGVKGMIGCMIETRLGITAGLHVALGLANVHYIDLDGYLDLTGDILESGGVQLQQGYQTLPEGPGLGLSVNEVRLRQFSVKLG